MIFLLTIYKNEIYENNANQYTKLKHIQLNIPNDLVQMFGLTALQTYMQKRLELLEMQRNKMNIE